MSTHELISQDPTTGEEELIATGTQAKMAALKVDLDEDAEGQVEEGALATATRYIVQPAQS